MKLVECVPNFSEGRNKTLVDKLASSIALSDNDKVFLLDKEMDYDHNRCVITIAADPKTAVNKVFNTIKLATQEIDLNKHKGVHPRIGATDVVPFVPLKDIIMEDCIGLAKELGEKVGRELNIPVYLYGKAASSIERAELSWIRKGQFEGLKEAIENDPSRMPDFGPRKIHPTAGAIAIGARFFLIAYNVNLATYHLEFAKKIASTIRESSGGLPCVKAIGLLLEQKKMTQVSMNLTDYRITSIPRVYEAIEKLTKEQGIEIVESEIVGLVPREAIDEEIIKRVKLTGFSNKQIIEERLKEQGAN